MKKLISVILSFLIIFTSGVYAFADNTMTMSLVASNTHLTNGETLKISVELKNNSGVCAFMFTLEYDPSAFEPVFQGNNPGFNLGKNFDSPMISMAVGKNGKITFSYVTTAAADITEDGTLVTFEFKVKGKEGNYAFNLTKNGNSTIAANSNEKEVEVNITNAFVTISGAQTNTTSSEQTNETSSNQTADTSSETQTVKPTYTNKFPKTVTLVLNEKEDKFTLPKNVTVNVGDTVVVPMSTPLLIDGVSFYINSDAKFTIKRNQNPVLLYKTPFSFKVTKTGTYTYKMLKWSVPSVYDNGREITEPFNVTAVAFGENPYYVEKGILTIKRDYLRALSSQV
jgi:hypothetical protein